MKIEGKCQILLVIQQLLAQINRQVGIFGNFWGLGLLGVVVGLVEELGEEAQGEDGGGAKDCEDDVVPEAKSGEFFNDRSYGRLVQEDKPDGNTDTSYCHKYVDNLLTNC